MSSRTANENRGLRSTTSRAMCGTRTCMLWRANAFDPSVRKGGGNAGVGGGATGRP